MSKHRTPAFDDESVSPWRLARTALPLGLFFLTEVLLGITDLAVVGALGGQEVAAVGLGKTVILSYLTVGLAVLSAALIYMAEQSDARRREAIMRASLVIAAFMALLGVALNAGVVTILPLAGYDPG